MGDPYLFRECLDCVERRTGRFVRDVVIGSGVGDERLGVDE